MFGKKRHSSPAAAVGAMFVICLLAAGLGPTRSMAGTIPELAYARVSIDDAGWQALESLRSTAGVEWWIEADRHLLVLADLPALDRIEATRSVERLVVEVFPQRLFFLRRASRADLEGMAVDVLIQGGRYAVVQSRSSAPPQLPESHAGAATGRSHGHVHAALEPFVPNTVLARQTANARPSSRRIGPEARSLGVGIDGQRWLDDIETLSSFNRYTHHPDILNARDWIVQEFEAMPGLEVSTPIFEVGSTSAFNVIARLEGSGRPDDWYIVGAHYDAISENPNASAPGAEDNASGCAGVLELARMLSSQPTDGTVIFMCYSGEEQGLFGSTDHAAGIVSAGDTSKVKAVLTMDMIGYSGDADLDCLLETSEVWSDLADTFAAAAVGTDLRTVISFFPFGSDHVPYLNRGMPALLTIENDWDSYPGYHSTADLPGQISLAMGVETLKMNLAVLVELAGVDSSIFRDGFESGDTSAWQTGTDPFESLQE